MGLARICLLQLLSFGCCAADSVIGIVVPNAYERNTLNVSVTHGVLQGGYYFQRGKLAEREVVIVVSGLGPLNSAMATTLLIQQFNPSWIMQYGIAGSAQSTLNYGDVVVPNNWAIVDLWVWTRAGWNATTDDLPFQGVDYFKGWPNANFEFADYGNHNDTGTFYVQQTQVMNETRDDPASYYHQMLIPADQRLLQAAATAADTVKLQRCVGQQCLDTTPRVEVGPSAGVGGSGSIFVDNAAWRIFLAETYNVSVIEMESAPFAHVAVTLGVPYIAVRSVSDLAGGDPADNPAAELAAVAATNAALMVEELVRTAPLHLTDGGRQSSGRFLHAA